VNTTAPLLCYPLDFPTVNSALEGAAQVCEHVDVLKVGFELFVEGGPEVVRALLRLGRPVFLDLKLHDIPQTVDNAVARACDLGVGYLTIHCSGGPAMVAAATRRAQHANTGLVLLGVTVLTSLDEESLQATGITRPSHAHAALLASMGAQNGLSGFVCSVHDIEAIRKHTGSSSLLVTPGIRAEGSAAGDQRRIATPTAATTAGSGMLVVGRPIRDAHDPAAAARMIKTEIQTAFGTLGRSS
jgi:orotidine-5'-phosphate decarboxylase